VLEPGLNAERWLKRLFVSRSVSFSRRPQAEAFLEAQLSMRGASIAPSCNRLEHARASAGSGVFQGLDEYKVGFPWGQW